MTPASFLLVMLLATAQPARAESSVPDSMVAGHADSTVAADPRPVDVRGVVRDANGSPIRGATIRLTSETDTVRIYSDGAGRFHARITATRGVNLLVRAYGYRDLLRAYRSLGRPTIDAALALPPPYPLGGVTVTALQLPLFRGDASAAVTVTGVMKTG